LLLTDPYKRRFADRVIKHNGNQYENDMEASPFERWKDEGVAQ
jgi:hypothetical protein